ncbi:MAG: D-tyrosyl-tRNA(Tyr) deacylase [Bacteroidetes bacterium]|nr:D-tyrosyl-tRNA(Tyr) deacylase [Bacteroidota bacterium]
MRAVIQRVSQASVRINDEITTEINKGMVVMLGIAHNDTRDDAESLANKIVNLRIFPDAEEKMNLSVIDIKGSLLVISNFTLYANSNKGNRPNFIQAAKPMDAMPIYDYFVEYLRNNTQIEIQSGVFRAMMEVTLTNDGPVTIILEK